MLSIHSVSTPFASSSRVDSVGAGVVGGQDKVQMSRADALRIQRSPADALRADLNQNGMDPQDGFDNFVRGLTGDDLGAHELGEAIARTGEELKQAASEMKANQAPIDLMLAELQGAQEDVSPKQTDCLQEPTVVSSSLSSSLAQASYRSKPDKHL